MLLRCYAQFAAIDNICDVTNKRKKHSTIGSKECFTKVNA